VRVFSGMPDLVVRAAPVFRRMGLANLAKVRAQAVGATRSTRSGSA
jgi:hypothetical protein